LENIENANRLSTRSGYWYDVPNAPFVNGVCWIIGKSLSEFWGNHMKTKARINQTLIELVQGDITKQDTDAIVNAANSSLLGGGGVDGAIHRAAGPELLAETRTLGGCQTGDAKISRGYRLKARYVIHAVGPVYSRRNSQVAEQLASAYRRSLEIGLGKQIQSIAFPSISTGAYGYPIEDAAPIALRTICEFAQAHTQLTHVRIVLFDEHALGIFTNALAALIQQRGDLRYE
jgi:O-acetyl-ADP-ribose deacetylase (regulator of RNase III)